MLISEINKGEKGLQKMTQLLRALPVPAEELSSFPSAYIWQLTTICNSNSTGDLTPSSGLHKHLHMCAHAHE